MLRGLLSNGPICYVCCAFFLVGPGFPVFVFTFYEYMCSQWLYVEDVRICRFQKILVLFCVIAHIGPILVVLYDLIVRLLLWMYILPIVDGIEVVQNAIHS